MPRPVYLSMRFTQMKLDRIKDLTDHARAFFHMLILLTHEEVAAPVGRKRISIRVSLDSVAELLAQVIVEGEDSLFALTGAANNHSSKNPYLDHLGNHVRGYCLLHGWEPLAAHTLSLIVLLRSEEAEQCVRRYGRSADRVRGDADRAPNDSKIGSYAPH